MDVPPINDRPRAGGFRGHRNLSSMGLLRTVSALIAVGIELISTLEAIGANVSAGTLTNSYGVANSYSATNQISAIKDARQAGIEVELHPDSGLPMTVRGADLSAFGPYSTIKRSLVQGRNTVEARAVLVMENLSKIYGVKNAADEFRGKSEDTDSLGYQHIRLDQTFRGLSVFGGGVTVHFNQELKAYQVSGTYIPDIEISLVPKINGELATKLAKQYLHSVSETGSPTLSARELVVFALNSIPRLAYDITLVNDVEAGKPYNWRFWIDAVSGEIIRRYNDIEEINPPSGNGSLASVSGRVIDGEGGQSVEIAGWRESNGTFYLYNPARHWLIFNMAEGGYIDSST